MVCPGDISFAEKYDILYLLIRQAENAPLFYYSCPFFQLPWKNKYFFVLIFVDIYSEYDETLFSYRAAS